VIVVDDALLLAILAEQQGAAKAFLNTAAEAGEVFTTGSWFWRLARVVARPGQGALSRALAASSEDEQRRVHNALDQLPAEIGLLSLRRLVPVMAALPGQAQPSYRRGSCCRSGPGCEDRRFHRITSRDRRSRLGGCERRCCGSRLVEQRCPRLHCSSSPNHVSYQSRRTRMSPLRRRIERGNHGAPRADHL
jgi:hypothetical protein